MEAGCPSRERIPGSPRTKETRNTRGVPASGPSPKFCDLRGRWQDLHASSESQPAALGTDRRRRAAAQGAGRRPRVRSCSPCPECPGRSAQQSPERGLRAAARSWTRPGSPIPAPHGSLPFWGPAHSSATYWGSALAARWGPGPGRALRIPSSRRLVNERQPSSRSAQTEAPAAELQKAGWARGHPSE